MASEQARRLAEILGDDAFFPAECRQAQWHKHKDPFTGQYETKVGGLCPTCLLLWLQDVPNHAGGYKMLLEREREAKEHADDSAWHPEWRIGKGEPKPLDESYDTLEPFLNKALEHSGWDFSSRRESDGNWSAAFWRMGYGEVRGYGSCQAAAIVAAMVEVAERWRWGKKMIAP